MMTDLFKRTIKVSFFVLAFILSMQVEAQLFIDFNYSLNQPIGEYAERQNLPPILSRVESGDGINVSTGYYTSEYLAFMIAYKQVSNDLDISEKLNNLQELYGNSVLIYGETGSNKVRSYLAGISYTYPLNNFEFTTRGLVGISNIELPALKSVAQSRNESGVYKDYASYTSGNEQGMAANLTFDVSYGITESFYLYLGVDYYTTSATVDRIVVKVKDGGAPVTDRLPLDQRISLFGTSFGVRFKL